MIKNKYPMTYEEYEKRVIELFLEPVRDDLKESSEKRLRKELKEDPDLMESLYEDTCFRYDHPEIYGETFKKVFDDYLLESIPVHNLRMML